ncbi:hypothetical protein KAR91_23690 [Candidatus Pacearchaeota archaeon]|nr:hypothetical protein [Candidatus Pacearchaeota archaeon]
MIVIKSIETIEVVGDQFQIPIKEKIPDLVKIGDYSKMTTASFEVITGGHFVDAFGKFKCIGMTSEVERVLGIPMACFKEHSEQIYNLNIEVRRLNKAWNFARIRLYTIRHMSFWNRLKFLFNKNHNLPDR